MRGAFYPPPPVFIGGRQPYAPPLGQVQSGETPSAPPVRSYVTLGIILASWISQPAPAQPRPSVAPLIAIADAAPPPPLPLTRLTAIYQQWYEDTYTVIPLCTVAPLLAQAAQPDNPPPRVWINFGTILRQWTIGAYTGPWKAGLASQSGASAAPDAPPIVSTAIRDVLYAQWIPKPWWPLPSLTQSIQPPGNPPSLSYHGRYALLATWLPKSWWPLPAIPKQVLPSAAAPDQPPVLSRVAFQGILDRWRQPAIALPHTYVSAALLPPPSPPPPPPSPPEGTVTGTFTVAEIENTQAIEYPSNYEICDRTGFKVEVGSLRAEWAGAMVRPQSWEPRHSQDFVRAVAERQKGSPRPEQTDEFIQDSDQMDPEDL